MVTPPPDGRATYALDVAILEAALASAPVAIAIIDTELRYIRVNAACAAMTGCPEASHAGRTLREVNPLLSSELESAMRQVLATGEPRLNYRITRPTPHVPGGNLEIVLHITPFRSPDGTIAGICSTATDMTEWQRLQEQFHQAQKLKAVGQLTASIAHDFNNILTVITGNSEIALMDLPPSSPVRESVEEIRTAAERATKLAKRLLGTASSRPHAATTVRVGQAVVATTDLLRHAAGAQVTLDVDCPPDTGAALLDTTQFEQVLMNLVINAAQAMPAGGTVFIATRNVTLLESTLTRVGGLEAGDYVELTVTDTGRGMSGATLERLFEPFFSTKSREEGTGLGLATVLGIVRGHQGGIDVTSAPDVGTTFRILLPRAAVNL